MRALPPCPAHGPALEEIVDLKWLLSAEGVRIHVERMQDDAEYVDQILARAEASANPTLRGAASALRARLLASAFELKRAPA